MVIIIIILVLIVLYLLFTYNSLVVKRNRLKNAWYQIDVQLKRRYDLIPNLVETVKGYAAHEKEIFEKVAEARAKAMGAKSPKEVAEANEGLSAVLKTLFAVAEAYPALRASENFMRLQEELSATENKIAFARQFYNDTVMVYNVACQQFPSNIVAKIFNFQLEEFYSVPEAEKEAPKVKF
ncbi:MAG: LemA family protein [candidate division WOR-3 bacterium]